MLLWFGRFGEAEGVVGCGVNGRGCTGEASALIVCLNITVDFGALRILR